MNNIILPIFSVFGYILIGFILKKTNIIKSKYEKLFSSLSFNFLLPLALIVNFWQISFPKIIIWNFLYNMEKACIIKLYLLIYSRKLLARRKNEQN